MVSRRQGAADGGRVGPVPNDDSCQSLPLFSMVYRLTKRPLFGGAIDIDVPCAWRDVSEVRQVPDHQE